MSLTYYRVTCTLPVAKEMARYEGSEIISSTCVWADPNADELLDFSKYEHVIVSKNAPNLARWRSFGVKDIMLHDMDGVRKA